MDFPSPFQIFPCNVIFFILANNAMRSIRLLLNFDLIVSYICHKIAQLCSQNTYIKNISEQNYRFNSLCKICGTRILW